MTRKLDLSACWNDVMHLFRANRDLLLGVAGVFILLPGLAFAFFVPPPVTAPEATLETIYQGMQQFYTSNIVWIVLIGLASGFASVVMLVLILDRSQPSVSEAMRRGLSILLPYYAMGILSGVMVFLGSLAFVLPGIYLFIKLAVAGPAMVAERNYNVLAALRRSWALTKGNSGRILLFLVVVAVTAFFVYLTTVTIVGLVIRLAVEESLATTLTTLVDSVLSMFITVLMVCIYAALYRQLAGPAADEVAETFS
ncbi:glycerophosphoryl diester phosphodiesterase membrane domain-containing protein [Blastomonas sp.]|uniref:glycerophosphoryl diester phosphodiesterase membrane domain-containing protein n=1 Tax=Blastomonas sp. TaxID=1909299 RepID=UPI0026295216|nr:glycerophosphoryl diester phosphodiesterase membrane domain-containing protein [Blastomonas sp.]MDM7955464.1 glycerophosphoryl diester phosphodiesterase membrane domain-containing protein [Blastomonas sp.]